MSNTLTGDMALFYQTTKQTGQIKNRLQTLTKEMSTGIHSDLTKQLRGDTNRLLAVDREIARIDSFAKSSADLSRFLEQQQLQLGQIETIRSDMSQEFLTLSNAFTQPAITQAALNGRNGLDDVVNRLNATVGDKALFAGATFDSMALASADDMMTDILAAVGGATTTAAIVAAIDTWFDTPGGGFETVGYLGDTGAVPSRQINVGDTVQIDARADDPAIRDVLKGFAIASVVHESGASLPEMTRIDLMREAGMRLNSSAVGLINLSANVGSTEARVDDISAMMAAKRTAFAVSRNDLVQVDPFATALDLQDVQTQLEIQFSMTSRLSGLSLVNFI